jgi:hypothetical protein
MNYLCENCNYTTTKKSDYNKHLLSNKHKENSQKQYTCKECKKIYKVKSSYYYHIKKCNNNNLDEYDMKTEFFKMKYEMEKLKNTYNESLINSEKEKVKILQEVVNNTTKTTAKALKITDKTISAIKYANEHFKNAPELLPINNFNMLNYDLNDEEDKKLLLETLLYHYRKNSVHKVFGDHIVSIYKKDNITDQSMHTTDTSRMNYIVKIAKDNNNAKWYTDKNGLVISDVIIEKLINHYVELLKWYQHKLTEEMNLNPGIIQPEKQQKLENILGMLMEVDNGQLVKNTNKYIAPFFNLDK